jgi:hypothetical protein
MCIHKDIQVHICVYLARDLTRSSTFNKTCTHSVKEFRSWSQSSKRLIKNLYGRERQAYRRAHFRVENTVLYMVTYMQVRMLEEAALQ